MRLLNQWAEEPKLKLGCVHTASAASVVILSSRNARIWFRLTSQRSIPEWNIAIWCEIRNIKTPKTKLQIYSRGFRSVLYFHKFYKLSNNLNNRLCPFSVESYSSRALIVWTIIYTSDAKCFLVAQTVACSSYCCIAQCKIHVITKFRTFLLAVHCQILLQEIY
jgi:hypothetical protein